MTANEETQKTGTLQMHPDTLLGRQRSKELKGRKRKVLG